jgi:hypothetical protein
MPNTSRLQIPYPSGTTANDVPTHMQQMADSLDSLAVDLQGTLAARPAAGVRGRYYWATDSGINGGLYRDNGTVWTRLSPSPWVTWTPTVTQEPPGSTTVTLDLLDHARYRVENGTCDVSYCAAFKFTGAGSLYGLRFTLPVTPRWLGGMFVAEAQNDAARCFFDQANYVTVYPRINWITDNVARWLRFDGRYEIA